MTNYKLAWWMNPWKMIVFFVIPLYLFIWGYVELGIDGLANSYLVSEVAIIGLMGIVFILIGYFTSLILLPMNKGKVPPQVRAIYLDIFAVLTIIAYITWFFDLFFHPEILVNIIYGGLGSVYESRNLLSTIPGVTTLTQMGIVYVGLYYFFKLKNIHLRKKYKYYLFIIIFMCLVRVVVWSERLAIIELLMPMAIYYSILIYNNYSRFRWLVNIGPFLLPTFSIIFFGIFEYFRSWINHYQYIYDSYFQFVVDRVFSYYYTALNNGAGFYSQIDGSVAIFTLDWVNKFPIINELFLGDDSAHKVKVDYLTNYANPEFTNMSGIFPVFYDWGWFALLLFSFFGVLLQRVFFYYKQGDFRAFIIFPTLLISLIEIIRINYSLSTRAFPVFLTVIIFIALRRLSSKQK